MTESKTKSIKVFISYSHDSAEHKERVLALSNRLCAEGVDCILDQYETAPPEGWPKWCMKQQEESDYVLVVFSKARMEESGAGAIFELTLAQQELYDAHCQNRRFIPVVFQPEEEQYIPGPLRGFTRYCLGDEKGYLGLYRHLTGQPEVVSPEVGEVISLPPRALEGKEKSTGSSRWLTSPPPRAVELFGRDRDASELADALEREHAVVLVNGIGGIGKTELCKQYAWKESGRHSRLAWIDYQGDLSESLVKAFHKPQIGFDLNPDAPFAERYACLVSYLEELPADTLLVVDNLDNPDDLHLETLLRLPLKVLVSSRLELAGFFLLPLDFLDAGACRKLFLRHYRCEGEIDEEAVDQVIQHARKHTLTVELLAKTARKDLLPIPGLLKLLESVGLNLDEAIPADVTTPWCRGIKRGRFFGHLRKAFEVSRLSEAEMELLVNLSLLPDMEGFGNEDLGSWLGPDAPALAGELADRGWLLREGNEVSQHPVISEVVRHESPPTAERCRGLIKKMADLLEVKPMENPLDKERYVLLSVSVLERLREEDEDIALLAHNVSRIYWPPGQLEQALEYQLKATKNREKILTPLNPDLALSYNNLSMIYQAQGEKQKAITYAQKAVDIMEQLFPNGHFNLDIFKENLAIIKGKDGI